MLVLSRKKNERILFPNLGIEVEILRLARHNVGVGIKAPQSVQILRGELAEQADLAQPPDTDQSAADRELLHTLRNQLYKAQLTVSLAQKQLQTGQPEEAEAALQEMLDRLNDIDQQITGPDIPDLEDSTSARRHALLVEDDPNERTLLAGYLRLCGFRVSEAGDGVEALEFLDAHDVDLVVLDMRMPRMDGSETVRAIRRNQRLSGTKVVVVSGEDPDDSIITGDERGVSDWLTKPLDPARLVRHLEADAGQSMPRPK